MKNEIVKLGFILFLITSIAAGVLAFSNNVTAEIIIDTEEAASNGPEVAGAVIPGAVKFEPIDQAIKDKIISENEKFIDAKIVKNDKDEQVGYAVRTLSTVLGYGGDIELVVGFLPDGTIGGVKVLSLLETPGLGTNVEKKDFQGQFIGKSTELKLEVVKKPASADTEISALAGATFSSNSFTSAVNNAVDVYNNYLK